MTEQDLTPKPTLSAIEDNAVLEEELPGHIQKELRDVIRDLIFAVAFMLVVPISIGLATGVPLFKMLSYIGAALVFEFGSVALAVSEGMMGITIYASSVSLGFGMIFAVYFAADSLRVRFVRVDKFLHDSKRKAEDSRWFKRYAMFGLVPATFFLGAHVCAAVTVIAGWKRFRAAGLILVGLLVTKLLTTVVWVNVAASVGSL